MELGKRGVFFSIDSLIALAVLVTAIILIVPVIEVTEQDLYVQSDLVASLSALKIGEIDNSYASSLISNGVISDENKSVLETIAEFYVTNKTAARELSVSIFNDINTSDNIGIWFGNELIASKNTTSFSDAEKVIVERQVISGIQEGDSVTAFSGRAFLSGGERSEFFYFGGYVGEGNLSALIEYDGNITSAEIEIAIVEDFELYVNGDYEGLFSGSGSQFSPISHSINISNFSTGSNVIELKADNLSLNTGGGFIRITYNPEISYTQSKRYYFPGIEGVINFYGSFYVPNQLKSMDIHLRYFSNLTTFLNIGNVTVYSGSSENETNITLDNTTLASLLDYDSLTGETIPLRFGVEDADFVINTTLQADVFSVTDISGSMLQCNGGGFWCCLFSGDSCSSPATCSACSGTFEDKLTPAKNANEAFINALLDVDDDQVGLVAYSTSASEFHELSRDNASLQAEVDSWDAGGSTCICCGINTAVSDLVANSSSGNYRSIVVMSDGDANQECVQQGTGDASDDAIQAACDAYNDHGIIVYAVGFGSDADEVTLQSIASCGNGNYYFGSISSLLDVYEEIAEEIISASFFEQTAIVTGNFSSKLFGDSYIDFEYEDVAAPFGLLTTSEKSFDDINSGTFSIPNNATVLETRVISYSGQKWTDAVYINGTEVYNLSKYGNDYLDFGDPFTVNIPNALVTNHNLINLTTAIVPGNSSGGSVDNKIIYTIVQDNVAAYSSLSFSAEGCNWNLEFEDLNTLGVSVPSDYVGFDNCYYTSGGQNITDTEDAFQVAVLRLLELLDFDSDGKIDVGFTSQDLGISSTEITGIPFDWSTEVQIRTWY